LGLADVAIGLGNAKTRGQHWPGIFCTEMIHQARGFHLKALHLFVSHQTIPDLCISHQSIRWRNQTVMNHRVIFVCDALIAPNRLLQSPRCTPCRKPDHGQDE